MSVTVAQGNSPKPRTNAGEAKSTAREIRQPGCWYSSAVFSNSSVSSADGSTSVDLRKFFIGLLFMVMVLSNILPLLLGLVFMSNQQRFDCCLLRGFEVTLGLIFPPSSVPFSLFVVRHGTRF